MAGCDTVRGITFQHAAAIHAVLDGLEHHETVGFRFEGGDDVIDLEALGNDGSIVWAAQMRTRQEPATWSRGELVSLARRWFALTAAADATFDLVTDAQLGPSGVQLMTEVNRAGVAPESAKELIIETGANDASALSRFRVRSRAGSAGALLERAESRVLRLLPRADATPEVATARIDAVFREISLRSGESDTARRYMSCEWLASLVGVPLHTVSSGVAWSADTAKRYRKAICEREIPDHEVQLSLTRATVVPHALRLLSGSDPTEPDEPSPIPLDEAIRIERFLIVGPSGCGKSVTARQLVRVAATAGFNAVLVTNEDYLPWRLDLAITDAVESVLQCRVARSGIQTLLHSRDTVVVFDGMSELDTHTAEALAGELRNLRRAGAALRCIGTGRDVPSVRRTMGQLGVSAAFSLSQLGRDDRMSIADSRSRHSPVFVSSPEMIVAEIERVLGRDASDPLLFSMALSSALGGRPIGSRVRLFAELLDGFAARNDVVDADVVFGLLGVAFARLIDRGVRFADRFEWIELLRNASQSFGITIDNSVLDRAIESGLLTRSSPLSPLSAIHDSVADFLAARAVERNATLLPSLTEASTEQVITFLAEMTGLEPRLAQKLAMENSMLAVRASVFGYSRHGIAEEAAIASELLRLVTVGTALPCVQVALASLGSHQAIVVDHAPSELTVNEVRSLAGTHTVLTTHSRLGPLAIAARAWASLVEASLAAPRSHTVPRPADVNSAIDALTLHERRTQEKVAAVVGTCFPENARSRLRAELGLFGFQRGVTVASRSQFGRPA